MPSPPSFRVFLSAVSSEFAQARSAVASDLRSRGLEVKVQEDFRQEADADTTLRKLHNYIRDCDAVICLFGQRSGDGPPPAAAEQFRDIVPADFPAPSYTQWEFFFARHYGKRLSIYIGKDYPPDQPVGGRDTPELAEKFLRWLIAQGLDRGYFSSRDQLGRSVLREDWPSTPSRRIVHLPYPTIGTLFKGREEFLVGLREQLRRQGASAIVARHAIHGLGGVGKTRLAVEYAWRHQADYTALLFAGADTPANLRRNLAELVGPLVLDLKEAQEAREEEVRVAAVLRWLESHPGWFLILDNVDTEESAKEVEGLLTRLLSGHVLITSRLRAWAPGVEKLELDVLAAGPAKEFLLERTAGARLPATSDEADADALATALDGLALALEQAGAYVCHVRCSLAEYLTRWRKEEKRVVEWFDVRQMKYPRSVAVTWETTWLQLSAAGRCLLEILAWWAPDPIPEWALTGERTRAKAEEALSGSDVEEALADLERYSMLKRVDGDSGRALLVHRLVQEVTRRRVSGPRQQLEAGLGFLEAAGEGNPLDVRSWPIWEALAPHVRVLVDHADKAGIGQPTTFLMNQLASLFYAKALHAEAEPLMRRALAIDEASLGGDHPNVARDLNNLAQLLKDTNRPAEAEPLMRRAVTIFDEFSKKNGHTHPHMRAALGNYRQLLEAQQVSPEEIAARLQPFLAPPAEPETDPHPGAHNR
jgi:hypothetical protein